MICKVCGGVEGGGGVQNDWTSTAARNLSTDTSRTCLCGVSTEQLESLLEEFETKMEQFLMANFPGKTLEQIQIEVRNMPRQSTLRVHTVKRISYRLRLKELLKKHRLARRMAEARAEQEKDQMPGIARKKDQVLPMEEGGSINDFALESGS